MTGGTAPSPASGPRRPPSTPRPASPGPDRFDALCDCATDALAALPAPDLAALAAKLDVIVPHSAWELAGSEDCIAILRRDAQRLAATNA